MRILVVEPMDRLRIAPPLRASEFMPSCRALLCALLGSAATVDWAADGAGALDRFRAAREEGRPFDLVCIELGLPDMDGLFLLRCLRRDERSHGTRTRALMVSGWVACARLRRMVRARADGYVALEAGRRALDAQISGLGLLPMVS